MPDCHSNFTVRMYMSYVCACRDYGVDGVCGDSTDRYMKPFGRHFDTGNRPSSRATVMQHVHHLHACSERMKSPRKESIKKLPNLVHLSLECKLFTLLYPSNLSSKFLVFLGPDLLILSTL